MKMPLVKARPEEFEPFGYETRILCGSRQDAIQQCGLHLHAYEDHLQPQIRESNTNACDARHEHAALRSSLYERPVPVSDAMMVSQERRILLTAIFAALAVTGCLGANIATFVMAGAGLSASLFALGLTIFPVVAGHLAFESIVSKSRRMIALVALGIVVLIGAGLVKIGMGRRGLTDRAFAASAASSYVDGENAASEVSGQEPPVANSESKMKRALSDGIFLFIIATELAAGLFIGQIVHWATEEDYVVWKKVKELAELIAALDRKIMDLISRPQIAQKYCMAGILRAENARPKPRPPYHRSLNLILAVILALHLPCRSQTVEHYQGILIDASASISRGGKTNALFHEYLLAIKDLLLHEPPSSRVWVSTISTNSFGDHEILKGWTPESHGVFTDDLNRARRELASAFETKSSALSPIASSTDIFGGLWQLKARMESRNEGGQLPSREIWIYSDMMNDTKEFPMPEMVRLGPQQMLAKLKTEDMLVPLRGYTIHVCGASTSGMSSKEWLIVKEFWIKYFTTVGACMASYSTESTCGPD